MKVRKKLRVNNWWPVTSAKSIVLISQQDCYNRFSSLSGIAVMTVQLNYLM